MSSKNTSKNTARKNTARKNTARKVKTEAAPVAEVQSEAAPVAPIVETVAEVQAAPAEVQAAPVVTEAAPVAPAIPVAPAAPKPTKTRDCVLSLIRLSLIATESDIEVLKSLAARLAHRAAKEAQKGATSKEGRLIALIKAASVATPDTLPELAKIGADSAHRLGTDYYSESRYSSTFDKTVEAFRPAAPAAPQAAPVG